MIKNVKFVMIALVMFSFMAVTAQTSTKNVKNNDSKIVWKGYKVTGSHEGTIALKSGSLSFNSDKLTGGEFVIDMPTLVSTDMEGEYKGKLEGHLKSDDFFGVEKYPTAKLVFTSVTAKTKNSYSVTADLTIKGTTKPITFDMSIYGNKATASLKIDRTKYGVKYGSASFFDGLKDKAIYDEFDIVVDLVF